MCLSSDSFLETIIDGKCDPVPLRTLIEHLAFGNEQVSKQLAAFILRGMNKTTNQQIDYYFEALRHFLSVKDKLQQHRIEWIIGFPQPKLNWISKETKSFGIFGLNSIEDFVCDYKLTLGQKNNVSLLDLILISRNESKSLLLTLLTHLLTLCSTNLAVYGYLESLPPPSYNLAKYTDWISPFLMNLKVAPDISQRGLEKALIALDSFEKMATLRAQSITEESKIPEDTQTEINQSQGKEEAILKGINGNPTLKSSLPVYIIGETVQEKELREIELLKAKSNLTLIETEIDVFIVTSYPTGNTNLAFPSWIRDQKAFDSSNFKPNSAESHFINSKAFNAVTQFEPSKKIYNDPVFSSPAFLLL